MNYLLVGFETAKRECVALNGIGQASDLTSPYVNRLNHVAIRGVVSDQHVAFTTDPRHAFCPAVQVADFFNKLPGVATKPNGHPNFTLIGFDPRAFYKLLGTDCALPGREAGVSLPYQLWGGHSEYWDIESLLVTGNCTGACKAVGFAKICEVYKELYGDTADGGKFSAMLEKWVHPHLNAEADLNIVHYFAERLGVTG